MKMPEISDKFIKLMLVVVILFSTVILGFFLVFFSLSEKYNINDTHMLSDQTRNFFDLLMLICVYYFGSSQDSHKVNDNMQQMIAAITQSKPVVPVGDPKNDYDKVPENDQQIP